MFVSFSAIKMIRIAVIFLIAIVLSALQTESNSQKVFIYYYYPNHYNNPNTYQYEYDYTNDIYDNQNYHKSDYYGKTLLKNSYNDYHYYPNCLTTRSKCWTDKECCGLECIKFSYHYPGVCGRDE